MQYKFVRLVRCEKQTPEVREIYKMPAKGLALITCEILKVGGNNE